LSIQGILFFVVFLAVALWMLRLFLRMRKQEEQASSQVAARIDELEREYVSLKPELAEIRVMLDSRVDYPYLERKMHELVTLIMSRSH
jgi:hypothetical protein